METLNDSYPEFQLEVINKKIYNDHLAFRRGGRDMSQFRKLEEKDLPTQEEAWAVLAELHRITLFKDPASDLPASLTPKAPVDQQEFFKKSKIVLRPIDMQHHLPNGTPTFIKSEQVENLISLVTVGHIRAYRKGPATVWAPKDAMVRIRQDTPSIFNKDEGSLFYINLNRTPSLVLERNLATFVYNSWKDGTQGLGVLREQGHSTPDCACMWSVEGNNWFGAFYALSCVPAEHAREYPEQSQDWDSLKQA